MLGFIHKNLRYVVAGVVFLAVAGSWAFWDAHRPRYHVTLYLGDEVREILTPQTTVAGVVREQGIRLGEHDLVAPSLSSPVTEGLEIDLGLVERRVRTLERKLFHLTHTEYADHLNVGEIIDLQLGKDGLLEQEVETFLLSGEEAFEKILKSKVLRPAQDAKVVEGTGFKQKLYPLEKRARAVKTLVMEATAYYPGPEDTWPYATGTTASGLKAGYGVVAVDPKVIRLKTPVYVEGYGYALAADKGGAIKKNKIDLCFDTYEEAVRFGRKKVKVYILR